MTLEEEVRELAKFAKAAQRGALRHGGGPAGAGAGHR